MTSFLTKPVCLSCWREFALPDPAPPGSQVHPDSLCFRCGGITNYGLVLYISYEEPEATTVEVEVNVIKEKIDAGTWDPSISLTYACPSCGDEIDLREAQAL